jgi:predicted dehydrogenase
MDKKNKIGIIGFGNRGYSFAKLLVDKRFLRQVEFVSICDDEDRKAHFAKEWLEKCDSEASVFADLKEFLKQPMDAVIIATPQFAHVETACAALEAGFNVFLEKPMARTLEECNRIIDSAKISGKQIFMGFNLRHHSVCMKLKELIELGHIGKPQNIICTDFYSNGYSYFRRWHRYHKKSGGLMVEKGCHSLDLINWFVDSIPVRVASFGGLDKFKSENQTIRHCRTCGQAESCTYFLDVEAAAEATEKNAGLNPEWVRGDNEIDVCVFDSEKDTFDNNVSIIEYANGCRASYIESFVSSVKAKTGRQFIINGTKGQLWASLGDREIVYYPDKVCKKASQSMSVTYKLPHEEGNHGGADDNMLKYFIDCLSGKHKNEKMCYEAGRIAVMLAEAAEKAAEKKCVIELN